MITITDDDHGTVNFDYIIVSQCPLKLKTFERTIEFPYESKKVP